jgi:aspartyl-tRNA(Asn)/glutamyl-tRNA(Gln) amidotransferase subunit C
MFSYPLYPDPQGMGICQNRFIMIDSTKGKSMAETLTKEQVAHVAHLARLSIAEADLALYTTQLSDILASFEQLNVVDTDAIEPVAQVTGLINVLEADQPRSDVIDHDTFLASAPAAEPPYLKVKAVFE